MTQNLVDEVKKSPDTVEPISSPNLPASSTVKGNFCIQCGAANPLEAHFCGSCGSQLPPKAGWGIFDLYLLNPLAPHGGLGKSGFIQGRQDDFRLMRFWTKNNNQLGQESKLTETRCQQTCDRTGINRDVCHH
ncbi:MAG: zinc ribbon domain-containing protein [Anaerolineales bacterium]